MPGNLYSRILDWLSVLVNHAQAKRPFWNFANLTSCTSDGQKVQQNEQTSHNQFDYFKSPISANRSNNLNVLATSLKSGW